jgi:hypothetical protein
MPPPLLLPPPPLDEAPAGGADDSRSALLSEINVGGDITKRLRHVEKSEKVKPISSTVPINTQPKSV